MSSVIDCFHGPIHGFLSNFAPAVVVLDGISYPTVEHAYQAAKTLDRLERELIHDAKTPGNAKQFGKRVTMRADWDAIKIDVMRDLLRQKFQSPVMRKSLLATGDAPLVEGNTWGDRFWGVCNGVGQNWLGRLLEEIRAEIRRDQF